jgi:hypothetical protein
MAMTGNDIKSHLARLAEVLSFPDAVEILLIGGAAGVLTGQLAASRTTVDCDVIEYLPKLAQQAVLDAAVTVASERGLPDDWLNSRAMQLNILPDGWRTRKVLVYCYGQLKVFALSRKDLIATKFYAGHPRDLEDIAAMSPTADELSFARIYLGMLRVPSRQAHLDQVETATHLLEAFGGGSDA